MAWENVEHGTLLFNANNIATALSFAGSIFMIYHCLKTSAPRSVTMKLILSIAIADFLYSISNLMSAFQGPSGVTPFCYLEAGIRAFTYVLSIFFASCLGILCYKTVVKGMDFNQELFFKRSLYVGVVYCALQLILPAFSKDISYTNGDLFCYITYTAGVDKKTKLLVRTIYEAFPIMSAVIITLGSYFITVRKIRQLPEEIIAAMDLNINKLFWYPAVLLITFVPSVADNFGAIFLDAKIPVAFKLLHLLMTHAIGFTNGIVYGIQRKLYQHEVPTDKHVQLIEGFEDSNTSLMDELERAGGAAI